jgi:hypothetical protein
VRGIASWWCDDPQAAFKIALYSNVSVFVDTCWMVLLKFTTCRKLCFQSAVNTVDSNIKNNVRTSEVTCDYER